MDVYADVLAMESFFKSRVAKGRKFLTAAVLANRILISLARTSATWSDVADWLTKYGRIRRQVNKKEVINWRSLSVIAARMGICDGHEKSANAPDWERLVAELADHCTGLDREAKNNARREVGVLMDRPQPRQVVPTFAEVPPRASESVPFSRSTGGEVRAQSSSMPRHGVRKVEPALGAGEYGAPSKSKQTYDG
jgi:hypothetical protein